MINAVKCFEVSEKHIFPNRTAVLTCLDVPHSGKEYKTLNRMIIKNNLVLGLRQTKRHSLSPSPASHYPPQLLRLAAQGRLMTRRRLRPLQGGWGGGRPGCPRFYSRQNCQLTARPETKSQL